VRLKIVQAGEPVLREPARLLTPAEITGSEFKELIANMRETMHEAPGVGLAAPQVGLPLQLAVIEDREEYLKGISLEELAIRERRPVAFQVIVNPKIVSTGGTTAEFYEGCLSLPGFSAIVPRAQTVRIECLDARGKHKAIEASGWHARILQHEIDHLHGSLYIDKMYSRTFTSLENFNRFWRGKAIADVRAALRQ